NGNNLFGMKISLSGNTWGGSSWDGVNYYKKKTYEYGSSGRYTITAKFRKYSCIEDSIEDHSAYLLNAKNGSKKRYAGLTQTKSYKKQLKIIKNGGYATSSSYVSQLCTVIEKYNLTKWDK
ncbi:MAG: glucosaminidase domain-containing protein, partial [Clostridiales bacterium]|nr:glucosaminidase domain-containing protein [Clostridiales bacterium]